MRRGISPRLAVLLEVSRVSQGMSIRQAAKAAGVSAPFLHRVEQGQRGMSAVTAAEVGRVYRLNEYERDLLAVHTRRAMPECPVSPVL